MPIYVLLTVLWLGPHGYIADKVEMHTNDMYYCKALAAQIKQGDGATIVNCRWVRMQ